MSARISGVKNFESQKISFVRGFPFSHVQSASEKGSIFFFSGTCGKPADVLESLFTPIAAAMLVDIAFGTAPAGALAAGFAPDVIPPQTLVPLPTPFSRPT